MCSCPDTKGKPGIARGAAALQYGIVCPEISNFEVLIDPLVAFSLPLTAVQITTKIVSVEHGAGLMFARGSAGL